MANNFFHNNFQTNVPPVIEHSKSIYKKWLVIERNLPKCERYGLGQKINLLFIDLLDILQKASFSPINSKTILLIDAQSKIDSLRFFIQFSWELKLIPNNQFTLIGDEIENIGRMIGGWRNDLISKTSTNAEEKK